MASALSSNHYFHFKTVHLIFKYFICFCSWRILSSLLLPSQLKYFGNGKNQICFLTLLQIQVLNKNLTDNPGEDNPSLQYELRHSNHHAVEYFKNCMIRRKCELSSIPTSAKPRWGVETRPPGNSNTDYILYILYAVACSASSCKLRHCQLLWSGAPLSSSGLKEALYKYSD